MTGYPQIPDGRPIVQVVDGEMPAIPTLHACGITAPATFSLLVFRASLVYTFSSGDTIVPEYELTIGWDGVSNPLPLPVVDQLDQARASYLVGAGVMEQLPNIDQWFLNLEPFRPWFVPAGEAFGFQIYGQGGRRWRARFEYAEIDK